MKKTAIYLLTFMLAFMVVANSDIQNAVAATIDEIEETELKDGEIYEHVRMGPSGDFYFFSGCEVTLTSEELSRENNAFIFVNGAKASGPISASSKAHVLKDSSSTFTASNGSELEITGGDEISYEELCESAGETPLTLVGFLTKSSDFHSNVERMKVSWGQSSGVRQKNLGYDKVVTSEKENAVPVVHMIEKKADNGALREIVLYTVGLFLLVAFLLYEYYKS